jgi:hypothetical protein
VESAELIAIPREVRERVRTQRPESSRGPAGIPVADLMALVHARDSALGKVAAIGTVNPRAGGLANSLVQAWKRLVARVLDWHVREQVEFNRQGLACLDAAYARAQQNSGAATSVLLKLMADPTTPPSSRIRAALGIFGLAREALDLDIETRVSDLEHAAEQVKPSRR